MGETERDIEKRVAERIQQCMSCPKAEKHDLMGADIAIICQVNERIINFYARDHAAYCPLFLWGTPPVIEVKPKPSDSDTPNVPDSNSPDTDKQ